jgi:hypothetical protein
MRSLNNRIELLCEDILAVVGDGLRQWFYGDELALGQLRNVIHGILDDAFAEERSRVINDIRPRDE